ncbi:MAG: 2-oxo acid dehydrogenase subunit E2, partial [Gammaproteobacteria bacterium]
MEEVKNILIKDIADFDSVDVVEILVKAGDEVSVDQPLVTVESEKAMMDYPSPLAGVVEKVLIEEGGKIKEGDALITLKVVRDEKEQIELQGETKSNKTQSVDSPSASKPSPVTESAIQNSTAYASPGIQQYARELGVNLDEVQGSGRNQRIVKEDIQKHIRKQLNSGQTIGGNKPIKALDFSDYGKSTSKELTKIQKLTANNMLNAWQSIPHVTHFDQADVTQLELHRKQLANDLKAKQIKLTPLVFVIKALVTALKKFPQFNASLDVVSEKLIYKDFIHIGIAVDTR